MSLMELFENTNRRLLSVFAIYVAIIFGFAALYHSVYKNSPQSFAFNSDIQKSQSEMFRSTTETEMRALQVQLSALQQLSDSLNSTSTPPRIERRGPFTSPQVDLKTADFTFTLRKGTPGTIQGTPVFDLYLDFYDNQGKKMASQWVKGLIVTEFPTDTNQYRDVASVLLSNLETTLNEDQRRLSTLSGPTPEVWTYWDFLYFSTITQTTVGYGDMLPNNTTVRMLVNLQVLIGLLLLVVVINLVFQKATIRRYGHSTKIDRQSGLNA